MSFIQLIYASTPSGLNWGVLNQILAESRANNLRDELTGALICRADLYLQLIEGPEAAVDAAYTRIERDSRHDRVRLLLREHAAERLFPDWAMRDDPVRSWMWTPEDVAAGAVETATRSDVLAVFARLKAEPPEPIAAYSLNA